MKRFGVELVFGLLALMIISCKPMDKISSKSYEGQEFVTQSGIKYTIHKAGEGKRAEAGNIVTVNYAGRLEDGQEFDNSYKKGQPFTFPLGKGKVIRGWDEGIALLNVGDSATLTIPTHLGYGDRKMGSIPANSILIFDVELLAITIPAEPWDVTGLDTIEVQKGLKMIYVKKNESGVQAENNNNVSVHYTGYFENWKKFDSSVDRNSVFVFPLGQGRVIKGWDIGIAKLKTGEKARFIISPELAYGKKGYSTMIPKNATLIFDVELLEIN